MNGDTKILARAFAALAALTLLTAGVSLINLGTGNLIAAMAIAFIKATLVALFFMHVRRAKMLVRIFALGGLFWLLTLIVLTLNDFMSRAWMANPSIWSR